MMPTSRRPCTTCVSSRREGGSAPPLRSEHAGSAERPPNKPATDSHLGAPRRVLAAGRGALHSQVLCGQAEALARVEGDLQRLRLLWFKAGERQASVEQAAAAAESQGRRGCWPIGVSPDSSTLPPLTTRSAVAQSSAGAAAAAARERVACSREEPGAACRRCRASIAPAGMDWDRIGDGNQSESRVKVEWQQARLGGPPILHTAAAIAATLTDRASAPSVC